jgi:hypothetical protein
MRQPPFIEKRSAITGVVVGALYGIVMRLAFDARFRHMQELFGVMTLGFLFIVPLVLGAITVHALPLDRKQKIALAIFLPWTSLSLSLAAMLLLKIEGLICVVMALPILLVLSSIGGLLMRWYDLVRARKSGTDRNQASLLLLLVPFLFTPGERQIQAHDQLRPVTTSIVIDPRRQCGPGFRTFLSFVTPSGRDASQRSSEYPIHWRRDCSRSG